MTVEKGFFPDGWKLSSCLSSMLGLNDVDYFAQAARNRSLPKEWEYLKDGDHWFIKPSEQVLTLMVNGYIGKQIDIFDDQSEFEHIITVNRIQIGFWK